MINENLKGSKNIQIKAFFLRTEAIVIHFYSFIFRVVANEKLIFFFVIYPNFTY